MVNGSINQTDATLTGPSYQPYTLAVALAPKPSAILSVFASTAIAISILRNHEKRRRTYHTFVCGALVGSAVVSAAAFWGTWALPPPPPLPSGKGNVTEDVSTTSAGYYPPVASGTTATCSAQGFLVHMFGLASQIYLSAIIIHTCISMHFNFARDAMDGRHDRARFWKHAAVWAYPISSAAALVWKGMFNPFGAFCYISAYPLGCSEEEGGFPCERGTSTDVARMFYLYLTAIPNLLLLLINTASFVTLCCIARRMEMKAEKFTGKRIVEEKVRKTRARTATFQTSLYLVIAGLSSVLLIFLGVHWQSRDGESNVREEFHIAIIAIIPLQGLAVSAVYLYFVRRFLRTKKKLTARADALRATVNYSLQPKKKTAGISAAEIKLNKEEFAVFDGTNPSSQWADFMYDDTDEGSDEFGY